MKLVKRLKAGIPFTTYSKKVDYAVRNIMSTNKIKHLPLIVIFRKSIDNIIEARLKRMGMKIKYSLPFIDGVCGVIPASRFNDLCGILEIEKIFLDSKAQLMGNPSGLKAENLVEQAIKTRTSYLNGKGVTVAFIDSGVHPHPDLVRPRNRIVEFRDFVSNIAFPYDDNGHGTACIGAGFGASMDGRFRTAAYESNIVCAKAFDRFGSGFYSDILASMQWILDLKEKQHIRIAILPFGSANISKTFDLLSIAVEKLWKNNIFVVSCTGNYGPYESSITSPGVSPFCYTIAACSALELPPRAASFSGKGPVYFKCDKPDAIMPGVEVDTLNGTGTLYTKYSGTSIAASLAGAAAALVCQKLPNLNADDIRSVLKSCTVSINEIKNLQGAGIININKLEDI